MSVRVSVSLSEQHDDFVRGLVAKGEYANASAVIQRAVELLRSETERSCADPDALRDLLRSRAAGEFVSAVEGRNAQRRCWNASGKSLACRLLCDHAILMTPAAIGGDLEIPSSQ